MLPRDCRGLCAVAVDALDGVTLAVHEQDRYLGLVSREDLAEAPQALLAMCHCAAV